MPLVLNLAKLEDQRKKLIHFVECSTPQGSLNNRVTIVFDGQEEVFGGMTSSAAKILFSQGESADDAIKKIVARSQNTKNIIVVSDDRDIQYAVRALGAKVCSVKEFLGKAKASGEKGRSVRKSSRQMKGPSAEKNPSRPKKQVPKSDEFKINSELAKIWLKQDKER